MAKLPSIKSKTTKPKKLKASQRLVTIAVGVVAIAALIGVGVLYRSNQQLKSDPKTLQKAQAKESSDLKAKVAKLIEVPKDENPTIATVESKDKLKEQPFFKDAQNGDKLLIFPQAKKAVLYRVSENRLINVGPIAVTGDQKAATKKVKLVTYKSNTETKAALAKISGLEISSEVDAQLRNYTKPQVVDVSGKGEAGAQQIADAIGGEVVKALPQGEVNGEGADFIVLATK
jgi:FtsZ-interacting cell division protein ZipA